MHHKRRRRKRGGHTGCCGMCSLRTTDGRRNGRVMTPQEILSVHDMMEQVQGLDLVCHPRVPVLHGYYIGTNINGLNRKKARKGEAEAAKLQGDGGHDGLRPGNAGGADSGLRSELPLGECCPDGQSAR